MKQLSLFFAFLLPFCTYAQINESFDTSQITARYTWEGDTEKYSSGNGFLQLNDQDRTSEAYVSLYGVILDENEWEFRVKSNYRTSTNNFFRIYLWSDKKNPADSSTAYYIELGGKKGIENQAISLCYVTDQKMTKTLITKKIKNLQSQFDIHIRVMTEDKQITVYARGDANPEFTKVGTTDYTSQSVSGFFILSCKYSSGHAKDKYFGPIYIRNFSSESPSEPEKDPDSLALLSLKQENVSTLSLQFNHNVNPASAVFSLIGLGTSDQIKLSEDEKKICLSWQETMEKGKEYTLSCSDLYDKETNRFCAFAYTFQATNDNKMPDEEEHETTTAQIGDLLINEIMADPKGASGLPETEYVELFNTTPKIIDLNGWIFCYAEKNVLLKDTVPANGYAVLYRESRSIQIDAGGAKIPLATFPSALANTGKETRILSSNGTVIDEFTYPKAKAGYSWERTDDGWNYSSDARGGTPGSRNSINSPTPDKDEEKTIVLSGEIIFSELLPEPQEGGSEYIELYNRSTRELSLRDLSISIRKEDGSLGTSYSLSSVNKVMAADSYVLLTKNIEGVRNFFLISSPDVLHELNLPILANTTSKLVLFRNQDQKVVDEVHYNKKWHAFSATNAQGIALERINLQGESQDSSNWTSASTLSGGGTPGYANSQSSQNEKDHPTGIQAPEYACETGNYSIAFHLDKSGYRCKAQIFDLSGKNVAEIINHELLGTEGVIHWDGLAFGGNKLIPGVYIFYAELYHTDGESKRYKKVFLIR
ncbi:MAG: lamin tail domain-containing protein [Massilibacteroides sp.]|nr:lamin tail domain-containing protein [Massilibacteroides sp.]MDD3062202.1 lamin tail domain-containing protein [Massilibacteroides sp.]MDD4114428.1 lamin tail domain-containing protein [Massilibacteroides sp.]MDD4659720.1 lamin tail domain-containing protein [Massilibacteroides sp.]